MAHQYEVRQITAAELLTVLCSALRLVKSHTINLEINDVASRERQGAIIAFSNFFAVHTIQLLARRRRLPGHFNCVALVTEGGEYSRVSIAVLVNECGIETLEEYDD